MPPQYEADCITVREAKSLIYGPGDVAGFRTIETTDFFDLVRGFPHWLLPNFKPDRPVVVDSTTHLLSGDAGTKAKGTGANPVLDCVKYTLDYCLNAHDWYRNVSTRFTFVGGSDEWRASLGLGPGASWDDFAYAVDEVMARDAEVERWKLYWSELGDINKLWRKHLRFLTPEEYEAEVGAAQVALETKVDPYIGPPAVYLK
jgi:hypothetical protein